MGKPKKERQRERRRRGQRDKLARGFRSASCEKSNKVGIANQVRGFKAARVASGNEISVGKQGRHCVDQCWIAGELPEAVISRPYGAI